MAIAISEFQAFSNFCPKDELIQNLRRYESLSITLKEELANLENASSEEEEAKAVKILLVRVEAMSKNEII